MVDVSSYSQIQNDTNHAVDLMNYIGLVKRIAIYLKGRVPDYIQLEDMIQIATLGLIEASKAYKPDVPYCIGSYSTLVGFYVREMGHDVKYLGQLKSMVPPQPSTLRIISRTFIMYPSSSNGCATW